MIREAAFKNFLILSYKKTQEIDRENLSRWRVKSPKEYFCKQELEIITITHINKVFFRIIHFA